MPVGLAPSSASTTGWGDAVRAGDVLALVDSPDAAAMAAERRVALAKAELARKTYARGSQPLSGVSSFSVQ
ncbi:hypothetical protein [Ralstonia insidiosa]|uniref:hypothetical protein n=1 Tax=Ralstonia insidiosa TaxID=190721 RepID=UPI003D659EDD